MKRQLELKVTVFNRHCQVYGGRAARQRYGDVATEQPESSSALLSANQDDDLLIELLNTFDEFMVIGVRTLSTSYRTMFALNR
jgi:hypothetical protein